MSSNALLRAERDDLLKLEKSLTREWLETNALGGYASSTVLMCPTRRYHGLLVSPIPGTVQRHVFLSRFEETLHGEGKAVPVSLARYGETWSPQGHQSIESFELRPWPSMNYRIGDSELRREILMPRGRRAVLLRYSLDGVLPADLELRLRPLLACRPADELHFENLALKSGVQRIRAGIRVQPYDALPALSINVSASGYSFEADPVWYRGLEYQADIARGYGGHEDQFNPGVFHVRVTSGSEVVVAASIEDQPFEDPTEAWHREAERRVLEWEQAIERSRGSRVRSILDLGATQYLYRDENEREGVVAGWPWFLEWGRDTYISLPGLTISRGNVEACGDALVAAVGYLQDGLLPNIFGKDRATSHYGSVDASLWFARAVRLYELAGGDVQRIDESLEPALVEIAECYARGDNELVESDPSGLVRSGRPDLNSTWMDARVEEGPVTPRDGFAVEICALWCFLLGYLQERAHARGDQGNEAVWRARRERADAAFLERFWLADEGHLADCVKDAVPDPSVRPNMVIAAALEFSPLSDAQRSAIVDVVERELLTPRGLRTLAPGHEDYCGHYGGDPRTRDLAYHQGTVWPWPLGFFVEAALRVRGEDSAERQKLRELLEGFGEHLPSSGVAQVSEVFDGDPPHRPGGTVAQAWSVAELLRSYALLDDSESVEAG